MGPIAALLLIAVGITLFVLAVIFILVPLFRGIGWLITNVFRGIGWLVAHIFRFIGGMIGDTLRFIGAVLATIVLVPLTLANVVVGRWSAASHFTGSIKRELRVATLCLYRVLLQRPLNLVLLDGLLEGIEQRVPEAMAGAPTADRPSRRTGQYEGYTIVGSLRGGGSGAKLYVAEPAAGLQKRGFPDRVVIKSFAVSEGSTLPQIVRESRALESAKQLGLVLEHGMDEHRFFYVMPYHAGEHLGIVTRQMHGESGEKGLGPKQLGMVMGYTADLVRTLATYHRGGLWHKDVKPDNVIVRDGHAHLVDLGLVTPLRSAMTLTTHGTEYFRDPEMVRQALRGTKVQEVDGAKFDIYAAGAVLYFMVENTFPAHGALSRFSKGSPEAIRWIVKRSMTEYNQRYGSAEELLADVEYVMTAADPFAVRPADLPSMRGVAPNRGETPPPLPAEPQTVVDRAGSPMPPRETPAPVAVAAAAAAASVDAARPKLAVTNWWTGAYKVDDGAPVGAAAQVHRDLRRHSEAFNRQMADVRLQVGNSLKSSRRAAKEQVRAARRRAKEMRAKAAAHRHNVKRAVSPREPSVFLAAIVLLAMAFCLVGVLLLHQYRRSAYAPNIAIVVPPGEDTAASTIFGEDSDEGVPVLLISTHPDEDDSDIQGEIDRLVEKYRDDEYDVVESILDPEVYVYFEEWLENPQGMYDRLLEDELEEHDLYGVLHVREGSRYGTPSNRVDATLIRSERHGAVDRRRAEPISVTPGLPLLLINDHPAKGDPRVQEQIDRILELCAERQWDVIVDDDAEVAVRQAIPAGGLVEAEPVPLRLARVLTDRHLAGVIRVDARPGAGEAAERIRISMIPAPVLVGEADVDLLMGPEWLDDELDDEFEEEIDEVVEEDVEELVGSSL